MDGVGRILVAKINRRKYCMNMQKVSLGTFPALNFVVESLGLHNFMFETNSKTVFGKVRNSIFDYLELESLVHTGVKN